MKRYTTILGFARSGFAAAQALHTQGSAIYVSEKKDRAEIEPEALHWLKENNIPCEFGGHTNLAFENCQEIIISPGVYWDNPFLEQARQNHIPVISELEFASRYINAPIIAVTGTNGKTTTTSLISAILHRGGWNAPPAGNIGSPASSLIGQALDAAVLEVSSFQLEGILSFHPKVAILLNITPDHIDRHPTMAGYSSLKRRIFQNQISSDYAIWNFASPLVKKVATGIPGTSLPFHNDTNSLNGAWLSGNTMHFQVPQKERMALSLSECRLRGKHNAENMMAASLAALALDIPPEVIREELKQFPGVPHRLETVSVWEGREFINDSKATNPESSIVGISAVATTGKKNIILIAGGEDKGTSLEGWVREVQQSVKKTILIGKAAARFIQALEDQHYRETVLAHSLKEAVQIAIRFSLPGEIILLSPACASFDMFRNYEDRGDQFRGFVRQQISIPTNAI